MTHLEIVRAYLSLSVEERQELKRQIFWETDEEKKSQMMEYIKIMNDLTGLDITEKNSSRKYVNARAVLSYVLYEKGFKEYPISRVLNKNHSTIHIYVEEMKFYIKHRLQDERIDLLQDYKQRLQKYETYR